MSHIWKPAVTVAAIIERQHRFLMVEEETPEGIRINQPAGHLEAHESLEQAIIRETLEETAHHFTPTAWIGAYLAQYVSPSSGENLSYLRFAFVGDLGLAVDRPLDKGIIATRWMNYAEILDCEHIHRSPLVLQCLDDYLRGKRAPLSLLNIHSSAL